MKSRKWHQIATVYKGVKNSRVQKSRRKLQCGWVMWAPITKVCLCLMFCLGQQLLKTFNWFLLLLCVWTLPLSWFEFLICRNHKFKACSCDTLVIEVCHRCELMGLGGFAGLQMQRGPNSGQVSGMPSLTALSSLLNDDCCHAHFCHYLWYQICGSTVCPRAQDWVLFDWSIYVQQLRMSWSKQYTKQEAS